MESWMAAQENEELTKGELTKQLAQANKRIDKLNKQMRQLHKQLKQKEYNMSTKTLRAYLQSCKNLEIQPTWEGLKAFRGTEKTC